MSTRALIGIELNNGNYDVKSVYLHNAGGVESAGRLLLEFYKTMESVVELIEGGDLSVLGETLKECSFYKDRRGEDPALIVPTVHHKNVRSWPYMGAEYLYLFKPIENKWYVNMRGSTWFPLENWTE